MYMKKFDFLTYEQDLERFRNVNQQTNSQQKHSVLINTRQYLIQYLHQIHKITIRKD